MTELLELQRSMARTVLGQAPEEHLLTVVKLGGLSPDARLRIHQNNFKESLSDALLGLFPLSEAFVGEMFLKQALRHFVREYPPLEAALFSYGAGVADFLQTYPAAASVPYLADMARLEWLTHELANAQEAPVFDDLGAAAQALASGQRLRLHANARLLLSPFPVYDLWRAATGQITPEDLDVTSGSQAVLLVLHEGQVFYQELDANTAQILDAIVRGEARAPMTEELLEELIDRGVIALP